MAISPPELLAAIRNKRFLGLDLGTKTIGLATSDPGGIIATPFKTIRRTKLAKDLDELVAIIEAEQPTALVLGLPINMDGTEGPRCQATRQFAHDVGKRITLPICLWDERLSTSAVDRMMTEEADLSRARRAEVVDKLAAAYILQGVLDFVARVK